MKINQKRRGRSRTTPEYGILNPFAFRTRTCRVLTALNQFVGTTHVVVRVTTMLFLIVCLTLFTGSISAQAEIECPEPDFGEPNAQYYIGQGNAYFTQGAYANATVAYTCAVERDPDYVPAYINRGYAYAVQRNSELALVDYNRALELDELNIQAYNNRGMLYTGQGNFGLAIADFTLALSFNPDFAEAYHNRGVVHAIEGNYDLALADLEQAIAIDDEYADAYVSLGAVYSAIALQQYERFYELEGDGTRLPAGRADDMMRFLQASQESENFAFWLPLLTPTP